MYYRGLKFCIIYLALNRGCFEAVLMKNTHGPLGVNNKIQLVKAACRRRLADMVEIESIIKNWELMCYNCEYQENTIAEPIGIDEAVEEVMGEY
jgi:hypothetical protein